MVVLNEYITVQINYYVLKFIFVSKDLSTAGDTPISRRKSFKKSLRESFRRLRKGRNSTRIINDKKGGSITPDKKREKFVFL